MPYSPLSTKFPHSILNDILKGNVGDRVMTVGMVMTVGRTAFLIRLNVGNRVDGLEHQNSAGCPIAGEILA